MLAAARARLPARQLVAFGGKGRVAVVGQGPFELAVIDAAQGQGRQRTKAEPADVECLKRRGRLYGAVMAAQEEPTPA
jgi:hypothetical protein